jgi:hypothetical protein
MALDDRQVGIIKAMLLRGDKQHWIAAYFDVNSGRVAEVSTGQRGIGVSVSDEELPPPGPYMVLPMRFSGSFEEIVAEKRRQEDLRDGE